MSATGLPQEKSAIGLSWAPKVPPLIINGTKSSSEILPGRTKDFIWRSDNELVDGLYAPPADPRKLNKLLKKNVKDTAGESWLDMPAPTITPELKNDLEILRVRSAIDPKRHFKRGDRSKTLSKYFQVGTIIEAPSEFFSSRWTKKERKATLADELLSDYTFTVYRKRKLQEIKEQRQPGGVDKWKNKGQHTWKRANQRGEKAGH